MAEFSVTPVEELLMTTGPKFCELLSDHVCAYPHLKFAVRVLCENVPPVFGKLPPKFRSPPLAVESVNAPLLVTLPRTLTGNVIAGEPLRFIVEPLSMVR